MSQFTKESDYILLTYLDEAVDNDDVNSGYFVDLLTECIDREDIIDKNMANRALEKLRSIETEIREKIQDLEVLAA